MVESANMDKEWQVVTESVRERLQYLHTSGEYSDLDIVFPKAEVTIKAHRLILAMSSPVFGAMLMGPLAAGKELTLPEDSPQAFRKLLDHMYQDQMGLESVEEAIDVFALAHKYHIEAARKACVQYIISNLEEETTLAVLEISIKYENEVLNKKCKEILYKDPDAVMLAETISYVSRETLRDLLKDDALSFSSEVVPFKGLLAWGKAQLDYQEEEPSGRALREEIGDLLKEVRFLAMSCDEFVDNVVDTNVLSHTECIHILRAIRGADLSTVPEDTPLDHTRARCPRLRSIENLSHFVLNESNSLPVVNCLPYSTVDLIGKLSSNRNIYVQYLIAECDGVISILDDKGEVKGSAISDDKIFIFKRTVALDKDTQYRITFTPKISCQLHSGIAESETVGNVTLSYSGSLCCALFFCE